MSTKAIQQLTAYFSQYLPLDEREQNTLSEKSKVLQLKRRTILLQEGDVCKDYYFVLNGLLRMYYVDHAGVEHNVGFASEQQWISDIGSFHSESPSDFYIQTIEATELVQIHKPSLLEIYTEFPKFDRNFRVIVEDEFVKMQKHLRYQLGSTAKERYRFFLKNYADIAHRLPSTQIASFIGITPEFLSKLKKEILFEG